MRTCKVKSLSKAESVCTCTKGGPECLGNSILRGIEGGTWN
jgi:hypothetical protein